MLKIQAPFFLGEGVFKLGVLLHEQIGKSRYEGPNNTDYRPGNTHDRLTAEPYLGKKVEFKTRRDRRQHQNVFI